MNTILTLNIDKNVVENAEIYAKSAKKSISQLVDDYLSSISYKNETTNDKSLGPITKQLAGIIKLDKKIEPKGLLSDALGEISLKKLFFDNDVILDISIDYYSQY